MRFTSADLLGDLLNLVDRCTKLLHRYRNYGRYCFAETLPQILFVFCESGSFSRAGIVTSSSQKRSLRIWVYRSRAYAVMGVWTRRACSRLTRSATKVKDIRTHSELGWRRRPRYTLQKKRQRGGWRSAACFRQYNPPQSFSTLEFPYRCTSFFSCPSHAAVAFSCAG